MLQTKNHKKDKVKREEDSGRNIQLNYHVKKRKTGGKGGRGNAWEKSPEGKPVCEGKALGIAPGSKTRGALLYSRRTLRGENSRRKRQRGVVPTQVEERKKPERGG